MSMTGFVRQLDRWLRAGALAATPTLLAAQEVVPAPSSAMGTIAGIVHETDGTPIADAEVQLAPSGRTGRTATNGHFILDSVPAGPQALVVRKLGYLPARAEIRVGPDSAVMLSIALVGDAQALTEVRITGRRQNLLRGTIVDAKDRPVSGAQVSLVGTDLEATTDSTGGFIFREVPTGRFLLQARKAGFELAQHGVRMVDRLERDVTMRLQQGKYPLSAMEIGIARIAARDAMERQGAREPASTVILGREDMAGYGRLGLDIALQKSVAATVRKVTPFRDYCIVIDGWRTVGRNPLSPDAGAEWSLWTMLDQPSGASTRSASLNPGGGTVQAYSADEIEMVEVYPEETEHSHTLCGRFAHGSGCECPPFKQNPPTLVIWLRK